MVLDVLVFVYVDWCDWMVVEVEVEWVLLCVFCLYECFDVEYV